MDFGSFETASDLSDVADALRYLTFNINNSSSIFGYSVGEVMKRGNIIRVYGSTEEILYEDSFDSRDHVIFYYICEECGSEWSSKKDPYEFNKGHDLCGKCNHNKWKFKSMVVIDPRELIPNKNVGDAVGIDAYNGWSKK